MPADGWHRLSCGGGAKGPRPYDRAWRRPIGPEPESYVRWRLIRRSRSDPTAVADFAGGGPSVATLPERVRVAGMRWAIEDRFERAEGDCGLDEDEVRSWIE